MTPITDIMPITMIVITMIIRTAMPWVITTSTTDTPMMRGKH